MAKPFGYGAPFAKIYRSWLHKVGLVNLRLPVTLTDFGQVVLGKDKDLSTTPTLWFMHHQLSRSPDHAEAWHYFVHIFRHEHENFSTNDLKRGLIAQLGPHDMKHFGEGSVMIPVITRKLLECYTSPYALGPLAILKTDGSEFYSFTDMEIPDPCKDLQSLAADFE